MSDEIIPYSVGADGVSISPGLELVLEEAQIPPQTPTIDRRDLSQASQAWLHAASQETGSEACLAAGRFNAHIQCGAGLPAGFRLRADL
jgi:hypothetical protein